LPDMTRNNTWYGRKLERIFPGETKIDMKIKIIGKGTYNINMIGLSYTLL